MKVLLQRVNSASVEVEGEVIGKIDRGLLLLVGLGKDDDTTKLKPMVDKLINMRIFPDEQGRFHLSVLDIKGGVLLIPQFTLFADTHKGRRPEFFNAMPPDEASKLFDLLIKAFKESPIQTVEAGAFGAYMKVALENDGPVTIMVEN